MKDLFNKFREKFEMDQGEELPVEFAGIIIKENRKNGFFIDQNDYMKNKGLLELNKDSTIK